MTKEYCACILIIGNEILSGRTQEANLKFLGERLNELGIQVNEARVIRDNKTEICSALNNVRKCYDYVFTTGGIGPTHDDITAESVAKAFNVPFIRNLEAEYILRNYYISNKMTEERLSMANMPEGAILIDNPISGAPGFQISNVFVLPGVPKILQAMFEGLTNRLIGGPVIKSYSIGTLCPEGIVAKPLGKLQKMFPKVEVGSYPFNREGKLGSNLVLRSSDSKELKEASDKVREMLRDLE